MRPQARPAAIPSAQAPGISEQLTSRARTRSRRKQQTPPLGIRHLGASSPVLNAPQVDAESVLDAREDGEVAPGVAVVGVEQCLAGCAGEAGCFSQAGVVVSEVAAEARRDCLREVCFGRRVVREKRGRWTPSLFAPGRFALSTLPCG